MVRNWESKHILVGARNMGLVTINVAEALAIREVLIWARRRGWNYMVVDGDSKLAIDTV